MQCPTAVRTTESNSKSVDICRTPRGKNNSGSPNTIEDRSTGGLALPAVPPATVREPRTDSRRVGVRWNCKPEISNAQDSSAFTPRRMSTYLALSGSKRRFQRSSKSVCSCSTEQLKISRGVSAIRGTGSTGTVPFAQTRKVQQRGWRSSNTLRTRMLNHHYRSGRLRIRRGKRRLTVGAE